MKSEILVDQAAASERETRASPRTALTVITHHLFNGTGPREDAAKTGRASPRARFAPGTLRPGRFARARFAPGTTAGVNALWLPQAGSQAGSAKTALP